MTSRTASGYSKGSPTTYKLIPLSEAQGRRMLAVLKDLSPGVEALVFEGNAIVVTVAAYSLGVNAIYHPIVTSNGAERVTSWAEELKKRGYHVEG